MSYEPKPTISGSGLFFGAYHSTTQALSGGAFVWALNSTVFPFDTVIGNASNVSNEIVLSTETKAFVTGDLYTSNSASQTSATVFSYGFSNSRYPNTAFSSRYLYRYGCDHADAFVTSKTQCKMHAMYYLDGTRNSPSDDFVAGVYV